MDKDTAAPLFLISTVVLIFVIRAFAKSSNTRTFYDFCGGKDKLKYDNLSGKYAIGINVDEKIVYLKLGGWLKAYPYSDIREWHTASEARVTGVNTQLSNQNVRVQKFFQVNVKDVEKSVWQLDIGTQLAEQWTEILNQEIKGI